jgi:riboflavin biosynthesis pyrimidine reductase
VRQVIVNNIVPWTATTRPRTNVLARGLIDELHLVVGPSALGGGTPPFEAPVDLVLLDARRVDGSNSALLRYVVQR